jgi:tetratricopeptide (TPR) repeat protein
MGNNNTSNKSLRISNLTVVTKSATSCPFENKEDATLVWLDGTIDTTRTTLREITDYVLLYTEIEPCITNIRSISKERIFLIVSGGYAEECLHQIHDLPQIDTVFIFCMNLSKYENELINSERYPKIIGIFDNEDQLIKSVREQLDDLQKQISTFSLYEKQKTTRDLSKESASFLWFQLFKDVLLRMPRSEEAKREMIDQCRHYYRGNTEELANIDEFAKTYTDDDTIRWYTKQCFIYRLCNKALRTEDIELLFMFRYYIQDLCKRLDIEHKRFIIKEQDPPIKTLYRGLKLTPDELTRFQSNVGSLISTNGFLSTTRNYELALQFALKTSKRSVDVIPTLFIIEVDISLDDIIFADITSLSVYPEEEEVLFDLGCAFKINEVYLDKQKNLWIIKMNLTNEARNIVEAYIEANRREMEQGNVLLVFGLLLTEMGQYHQAQVYFENLLLSNTIDDKASLYTNIGRVKFLKGLYNEALKDFKTVYDIQRQENPINYLHLSRTMNNLGLIYLEQKKYDLALDYFFDVLKIHKQHSEVTSELLLANTNNSIGVIFTNKHEYNSALKYLFRAMNLYETHLPANNHPTRATNYNSIGLAFYYTKQYNQALDYCSKALKIREEILPNNHPHIADSCNNVALIYHHLCEYEKALSLFQRSLQIYENDCDQKMRIPICLNNMGLLYLDQHDYDQSIEFYFKALHIYDNEHDLKKYLEEIGFTLNNLGVAYEMKCDFDNALKYYNQALENHKDNPEKFVGISTKIGNIYHQKGEYDLALEHYQKALNNSETSPPDLISSVLMSMGIIYHRQHKYDLALDIYKRVLSIRKLLSSNDKLDLAWTYNNIGCLYDDMGDMQRALKYQEKAYKIRRESLPSTHPDLATSLNNLGRIHQTLAHRSGGNPVELDQALQNYKSSLHIRRKSLPLDHLDLATSYYNLASVHIDQQEYEQADSEIQKALSIQRKKLSPTHPDLEQTIKLEKQIKVLLDYRVNVSNYTK